jgi:hypothetical protein
MWQVDQDPANMAILDAVPIPCEYQDTAVPVSNDLVFLTARGVRSMGIAGASTNLQAGFFGQAVDDLVLPLLKAALLAGFTPFALFYPAAGQYWIIFGSTAMVLTMTGKTTDASWSRYVFPSDIDAWAISGVDLYLRSGDEVWKMDAEVLDDAATLQVPGDAFFDDVSLLLHCDGANASTVFTDTSNNELAITATGTAQVSTTVPKFGTGSALLPGGSASWLSTPMVAGLNLNSGPFCVEFFFRPTAAAIANGSPMLLMGCRDNTNTSGFTIGYTGTSGQITAQMFGGGGSVTNTPAALVAGTWYHLAYVYTGTAFRLYINGVSSAPATVAGPFTSFAATELRIGADVFSSITGSAWNGQIDEVRITKGAARYTSNFTPPVAAFEDSTDAEYIGDEFDGYMAWNYLDFGTPGADKELESIDLVVNGEVSISVGWDQRKGQEARATAAYTVDGDTVVGTPIPINMTAPTMQLRLTFSGHQQWEWTETVVNIV